MPTNARLLIDTSLMTRVVGLLTLAAHLCVIRRDRDGATYFTLPGGQIEAGESDEGALIREVEEELGLKVEVGRLVAEATFNANPQRYFQIDVDPVAHDIADSLFFMEVVRDSTRDTFDPVEWLPLAELETYDVRPRSALQAFRNGALVDSDKSIRFED